LDHPITQARNVPNQTLVPPHQINGIKDEIKLDKERWRGITKMRRGEDAPQGDPS